MSNLAENSSWYKALRLSERLTPGVLAEINAEAFKDTDKTAMERLSYWRKQPPFHKDQFFAQRLAMDEITEPCILSILSESAEVLKERCLQRPEWLDYLGSVFSSANTAAVEPANLPELKTNTSAFLVAFAPWLSMARLELHSAIVQISARFNDIPFHVATVENALYRSLPVKLLSLVSRTMVLELNIARMQGWLTGDTPAERFLSFLKRIKKPEKFFELLSEYPVLARQLAETIKRWLNCATEFFTHFCQDWEHVRSALFDGKSPGLIFAIEAGMGDMHRGGRTVRKIVFDSGATLMYKPRSLSVDIHFQELLLWLNAREPDFEFRIMRVLDFGDHGWTEFIQAQGCNSTKGVTRFYEKQGGYIALLHALNAADFHHENLIAAAEDPVLIDLESLFHPVFDDAAAGEGELLGSHALDNSVLRTGLLPQKFWAEDGSAGVDLSGLGGSAGQSLPHLIPGWEQPGTDEMRFVRERKSLKTSHNQPTLEGSEIRVTHYQGAIEVGFKRMYRLLARYKNELLAPGGPLEKFGHDELRVILRPTRTYGSLLVESSHPDVLRDALDLDCLFDQLWIEVEQYPYLAKIIREEIAQLQPGDIPLFIANPLSKDLWSGTGTRIPDFFATTAMDAVKKRIESLGEEDLNKQLWFISASLTSLKKDRPEKTVYAVKEPAMPLPLVDLQAQFIAMAEAIGERLHALVLNGKQEIAWVGLGYTLAGGWGLEPAALDLYSGLPGIALFLAQLGQITGQSRYTELALKAIHTALTQLKVHPSLIKYAGFGDGAGGIIYVLSHLGAMWDSEEMREKANYLIDLLPPLIAQDKDFDIIYGSAGCIGGLRALHHCSPSEKTLDIIRQCAEHLVSNALTMPAGIAWPCAFAAAQPLVGFSHGAAGISWMLAEAGKLTGEGRFHKAALAGIAYEQSVFSQEHENWPDFRVGADGEAHKESNLLLSGPTWCNGAPGIGLSRLGMLRHCHSDKIARDIQTAIKITTGKGLGLNHCLCHGDLGNIELLIQACALFNTEALRKELDRAANIIHNSMQQHGWLTGVPAGVETPGLMAGLAGIGHGLLRLARPDKIPSVVSLDTPML